jgi:hypothetical protein
MVFDLFDIAFDMTDLLLHIADIVCQRGEPHRATDMAAVMTARKVPMLKLRRVFSLTAGKGRPGVSVTA